MEESLGQYDSACEGIKLIGDQLKLFRGQKKAAMEKITDLMGGEAGTVLKLDSGHRLELCNKEKKDTVKEDHIKGSLTEFFTDFDQDKNPEGDAAAAALATNHIYETLGKSDMLHLKIQRPRKRQKKK